MDQSGRASTVENMLASLPPVEQSKNLPTATITTKISTFRLSQCFFSHLVHRWQFLFKSQTSIILSPLESGSVGRRADITDVASPFFQEHMSHLLCKSKTRVTHKHLVIIFHYVIQIIVFSYY